MTEKESYRERQVQELEVIKSIFGNDVENLRPGSSSLTAAQWKPTDVRIFLTPLRDSSSGPMEVYAHAKLRITCGPKYPKIAPKVTLEETKGLSDQMLEELLAQLHAQSQELKGEVMIYELAQTVQAFLLMQNKPPRGSFYDEMLQEKQKREQELLDLQKQKETLERQTLLDEVQKRHEILKSEAKRRGEPRHSMSESNRRNSSSDSSDNSAPYNRSHVYPNKCFEHRSSETLYFYKVGRQIRRGCCLGHSQKGCIAYTGIDQDTGQLLYITEWNVKYGQLELSCNDGGKCLWVNDMTKCAGKHRVEDVIATVEKQVAALSQLHHKNLIQYECVLSVKRKEGVVIYLVQDFVLGSSVSAVSSSLGWNMEGARMVARGVLDAVVYLHNKGISHSYLLESTVFVDNAGTIRCTDYSLVPQLLELMGGPGQRQPIQGDLPALGNLVEGLLPSVDSFEMRDFIDKCNSDRTLSASELRDHPFFRLSSVVDQDDASQITNVGPNPTHRKGSLLLAPSQRLPMPVICQSIAAGGSVNPFTIPSLPASQSRLRTEFEVLMYLGKGAFGDVLKVRNLLDNREYAIKRIPLPARSRQLYKKMTREVELLSRLNHENVVRYFNSWIESVNDNDHKEMDELVGGDWSVSRESAKPTKIRKCSGASDSTELDDSDSDGIEFLDSNGEVAIYEDEEDEDEKEDDFTAKLSSPRLQLQVMYIQMEFCEKCTLRTAIDDSLYQNSERLWRLFREIAEGLAHIHQQGIIHRDLKPVNIFLDSRDQIKIGDFGLATTNFLALQSQGDHNHQSRITSIEDGTGTGKVGTTLYVAPELTDRASRSTYNKKVDMYTLGIILFEMSQPPFATGMERIHTFMALRSPDIALPEAMVNDSKNEKTVKIIRWLLNHDPAHRPTAEELLASDLVPPPPLEANELQDMLRHALANPQSKAYKHLVARCLQQESDEVLEHLYHLGSSRTMKSWSTPVALESLVSLSPTVEFVKAKVVRLFRKHGAIEVDTPLLSPFSRRTDVWCRNLVKLMTHSGCVVVLPTDSRTQFARHITMSGVNMLRRYCVDRIYREEKVFNFHPKENYECAFDVITPNPGSHLVDAELLALAYEITNEIPRLREKNIAFRMNHTNLLRSILLYCNVPPSSYGELFGHILDFIEGRISKFQFYSSVTIIMEKSRSSASALIDLLLADFLLCGTRSSVDESSLKSLLRGKGEAASLAKGALRELESIVALAQSLGVTCPIHICAGMPISYERARSGGIVWQMIANLKPNRTSRPSVLASGERYDSMLLEFQKKAQSFNANLTNRPIGGSGLTFSLDKLVGAIDAEYVKQCRAIDVGVCVNGSRPPLKDVTYIMRLLWSKGIRCGLIETTSGGGDEAQDLAKLGAMYVILVSENGALRVRSWERERFHERHVTRSELIEFIQKITRCKDAVSVIMPDYMSQLTSGSGAGGASGGSGSGGSGGWGRGENSLNGTSSSMCNVRSSVGLSQLPNVEVVFLKQEKLTANYRRRLENQVTQQMTSTLSLFVKKETIVVFVVELPPSTLNAIVGAINPRSVVMKQTEQEINNVMERFPKYKRSISDIYDEIVDCLSNVNAPIVGLYSASDSYYRFIV